MPKCWLLGFPQYFNDTLSHTGVSAKANCTISARRLLLACWVELSRCSELNILLSWSVTGFQHRDPFLAKACTWAVLCLFRVSKWNLIYHLLCYLKDIIWWMWFPTYSSVPDLGPDPKSSKSHRKTPMNNFSKLGASPWIEKENLSGCCCNFPSTKSSHSLSLPLTRFERAKYLTGAI